MKPSASQGAPETKTKLREYAVKARRLAAGQEAHAAQSLLKHGLDFINDPSKRTIAAYFPLRNEFDVLPLLLALHERAAKIALPVIKPGPRLIFREWPPGAPLVSTKFGLSEPSETAPEVSPDVVLVPLLAFDRRGNRLGYGAGYYDAGLRALRAKAKIIAVGVAYDAQEVADIPRESHDEPLDFVLTPSGLIVCGD